MAVGRSRGGLTSKIHVVVDGNGLPVQLGLTAGQAHDNQLFWACCETSAVAPSYVNGRRGVRMTSSRR